MKERIILETSDVMIAVANHIDSKKLNRVVSNKVNWDVEMYYDNDSQAWIVTLKESNK